jgi:hypothetical protein
MKFKKVINSCRDYLKYFQIFPNASLSIQHLSEIDEGDYVCSVQNAHGSDQVNIETP